MLTVSLVCALSSLSQLDELAALGIHGKTPGGTKWRNKHKYNLRSTGSADEEVVAEFKI